MSARSWLGQVRAFVDEDIAHFGCQAEIDHLNDILANGTSGDRQIALFRDAQTARRRRLTAIKDVIDWVAAETIAADAK